MTIRVLVADDQQLFAEGLCSLLHQSPGVSVSGYVHDGRAAIETVRTTPTDVVLMDMSMPGVGGIEATRLLVQEHVDVRVLCLTMHAERAFVEAALEAGAAGYVLKDCATDELVRAIETVVEGGVYLSPEVAALMVQRFRDASRSGDHERPERLSPRERDVLREIANGHSTKEVAACLGVSTKTVSTHRENLMRKLGIRSVAGLTKYALREGLTAV